MLVHQRVWKLVHGEVPGDSPAADPLHGAANLNAQVGCRKVTSDTEISKSQIVTDSTI